MKRINIKDMVIISMFTAIMCIVGPVVVPLPFSPVPISLTNFVIYIAVYILGMKKASISYLLYFLLGLVGLPVFSGFTGGLSKVVGPTGGYLIGFFIMALIGGWWIDHFDGKVIYGIGGLIIGTGICYLLGTFWLSHQIGRSFIESLSIGVFPFVIGDLIKIIIGSVIGRKLRKRLKQVGDGLA